MLQILQTYHAGSRVDEEKRDKQKITINIM